MIRTADRVSLGLLAATLAATALVYGSLPARIATHFDWRGQPDSWQPRGVAVAMLPGIALVTFAVVRLAVQRARTLAALPWIATATTAFLCIMHVALMLHAKDPGFDVTRAAAAATGALFVGLGLLLPRVRQNHVVGVRTPWTLRSPEVWSRTQRFAGLLFTGGGVVIGGAALATPALALTVLLGVSLGISLTAMLYSWRISAT